MKGDSVGQGVVPLRTILRNILNLIDSFETRYKEGLDSYDQEFQELKQFSENLKSDPGYLCKEGEKSVNRKKNRYKDILPFDYTRVILGDYGDIPGSDYINANFIKGASGSSAYIACQGPLPHTVNDFWRMVVECEVQVIVMACNEQESGKHKCENYWVEEEGVEREFGSVTIWLKKSRQVCPDFLVRTMKIRYPNSKGEPEERSVCQFHYSAWPDHGVPLKVRPLLDMVRLIRDCQTSETLPVLVHCSAGCGRTGTICAIDYVWGLLRLGKLTPDFSLFNLVREMRRQRIAMVQTKDQYILVHRAVRELFEEQLKIIDSHPYANVDINGLPIDIRADMEEPVYETVQFVASSPRLCEDQVDTHKKDVVVKSPSPPSDILCLCVQEKYADSHDRQSEEEKISKLSSSSNSNSLGSKSASNVLPTSSPSSGSHGEVTVINENKSISDHEQVQDNKRGTSRPESSSTSKHGGTGITSSKSLLLRNPSIVKLKAFFEKSKEDKDKKIFPGLSRAKSDVSSSSRFYTNLASTFTSRGNRNQPAEVKYTETAPPKSAVREKTPVEKIKSKPAILTKPNISVKRSKSLKIIRPLDNSRENVNLISSVSMGSDVPDGPSKSKDMSASISHTPASSQHTSAEPIPIKVNVQHVDMPKLQKLVSKSVKPESFKATTSHERDKNTLTDIKDTYKPKLQDDMDNNYQGKVQPPKKPDVPSKSHLLDKVLVPTSIDAYGTTKIKIGMSLDDSSSKDSSKSSYSKMNGKIKKYGTVNSKMLTSAGGGTLLTRSQSHVWQPSKPQVPVRIFSDDNLSQVGTVDCNGRTSTDEPNKSFDGHDSMRLHRKQSLPITKVFPSKVEQPLGVPLGNSLEFKSHQEEQQPRSLTLTSHSSFLEARKRVPKTNPYANYSPSNDNRNYKDISHLPVTAKVSQEKERGGGGSLPLSQFHFGESIPLLKNGNGNSSLMRNSSESSSNPGTPRNSLPGTPTQSTDVLYSPISLNAPGNYSSGRNQSKSILKGSLSSTPSESDERLDLSRNPFSSSLAQSQVTTNITGPQKISSVRTAVGVRERRNSFRQAVWKEDQRGPKDDEKPENIYITTTSSVPYFVKSSAMPMHHNAPLPTSMSSYIPSTTSATTTTNALERPHRDYEPIWPDPSSATNPFKIGVPDKRTKHNIMDKNNLVVDKSHRISSSNSSASLGEDKLPTATKMKQNELESQVQDRMAEIKVLLEELKAPGKSDSYMQRLNTSVEGRNSQIPMRKSIEKEPQSFSGEKSRSAGSSAAASGLKYHRSLRAPSRPQYQQSFACFTFKKPSSFESITDQVYAEELMASKSRGNDDSHTSSDRSKMESSSFRDEPYQQAERPAVQNQRLNDYVSLRSCKSSNVPQHAREGRPNQVATESTSQIHRQHHPVLSKSDSTPVPPPRVKRGGTIRRDQSNYVNITPEHHMFSSSNYGWASAEPTSNGVSDNHNFSNGTMSSMTIRKNDSSDDGQSHSYQANGQDDFAKISSSESIPLSNNNNSSATSPKAIIRALGLFQAKAANVRSRFANWSENKERPGSKRTN